MFGRFHLTGPAFVQVISPIVNGMKRIAPDYVIPVHCTGWDAIIRLMTAMPGQFIPNHG